MSGWLDQDHPHDEARSDAQIAGLIEILAPPPRDVLELGCGGGRVLVPLARAGHHVTGIDRDGEALARCAAALGNVRAKATLREGDFTTIFDFGANRYDAVLCLGNTFMSVADVDLAVDVLRRAGDACKADGIIVLDDLPHDLWPELTGGNWQEGVSDDDGDDGRMQITWHPHDAVFALRCGNAVDEACWTFKPDDALYRLWDSGSLRLAARAAGLSEPQYVPGAGLLVMRPRR